MKKIISTQNKLLTRRNLIRLTSLLPLVALSQSNTTFGDDHGGKHHHGHHSASHKLKPIIESSLECVKTGELCANHCIELFKMGDTSVADCANIVEETVAACEAIAKLAMHNSSHLKAFVKACINVCEECEKECRKHEKKHSECKDCADSCANCIKEYKTYLA